MSGTQQTRKPAPVKKVKLSLEEMRRNAEARYAAEQKQALPVFLNPNLKAHKPLIQARLREEAAKQEAVNEAEHAKRMAKQAARPKVQTDARAKADALNRHVKAETAKADALALARQEAIESNWRVCQETEWCSCSYCEMELRMNTHREADDTNRPCDRAYSY